MIFLIALAISLPGAPACLPVSGDQILGKDLARADAVFSAINPAQSLGYSPAPGYRRVFTLQQLQSIAESAGIPGTPERELCFELPMSPPRAEDAIESMRKEYPEAQIEIVDMSRFPVPEGAVIFPVSGLQRSANVPALWRGYVDYGSGRKFSIWARVNVTVRAARVIATETVRAGQLIQAEHVRMENYEGPPLEPGFAAAVDQVAGRVSRVFVAAGSAIKAANLESPHEITRGEVVTVQVHNGAAHITLQALAKSSGRRGETVQLLNESSGKQFRATVEGTGRAVVVAGGQ
jgi:flagella basal body P-ring formation protein FlgA